MKRVTINLFEINELSKEKKDFAIDEHKEFLVSIYQDDDFDESFNMTRSKYSKSLRKMDIVESIEANDYLFFEDGSLAKTVQYVEKHPRAGEHMFEFMGSEYPIK